MGFSRQEYWSGLTLTAKDWRRQGQLWKPPAVGSVTAQIPSWSCRALYWFVIPVRWCNLPSLGLGNSLAREAGSSQKCEHWGAPHLCTSVFSGKQDRWAPLFLIPSMCLNQTRPGTQGGPGIWILGKKTSDWIDPVWRGESYTRGSHGLSWELMATEEDA